MSPTLRSNRDEVPVGLLYERGRLAQGISLASRDFSPGLDGPGVRALASSALKPISRFAGLSERDSLPLGTPRNRHLGDGDFPKLKVRPGAEVSEATMPKDPAPQEQNMTTEPAPPVGRPGPSFTDVTGNAIIGGVAMAGGGLMGLIGFSALQDSDNFFSGTGALLFLLCGIAMGGLGFVGVVVNELLREVRKMRFRM